MHPLLIINFVKLPHLVSALFVVVMLGINFYSLHCLGIHFPDEATIAPGERGYYASCTIFGLLGRSVTGIAGVAVIILSLEPLYFYRLKLWYGVKPGDEGRWAASLAIAGGICVFSRGYRIGNFPHQPTS